MAVPTEPSRSPVPDAAEEVGLLWSTLIGLWEAFLARLPIVLIALVVFLVFLLAGRVARRTLRAIGRRTRLDPALADLLGRAASLGLAILGLLVAAVIVFPTFRPGDLVAGLGITSIALGFAFKDILQNWLAGVLILWRRPFQVGDQIRTGAFEGTVEAIDVRATRLRTYDGERAVLPNGEVYTHPILVRTAFGRRRVRLVVGIGYEASIDEARGILMRAVEATAGVLPEPGPWVYVAQFAPSSVDLAIYFWTGAEQANVLAVTDRVAARVKQALEAARIDIPYPHTVVHLDDGVGRRARTC